MRACGTSGSADGANQVAHLKHIPDFNVDAAHVKKRRAQAVAVIEDNSTPTVE
jgi:hypothetical protein